MVVEPPTPDQGARRVWSDSRGRIWVSEWNSGEVSVHDPAAKPGNVGLPGDEPALLRGVRRRRDQVWVSEWGGNAMFRFDPASESFERFGFPRDVTNIRQILGRPGEVWLPESGTEHISVIRTATENQRPEMEECAMSMSDRDGKIWMDGQMVDWRDAKIHVLTPHPALRLRRLRGRARLQHGRAARRFSACASTPSACSTAPRSCA